MSSWQEFFLDADMAEYGDIERIEWVEWDKKDVKYFALGKEHKVKYANNAAAQAAYEAFKLLVVPPPEAPKVGDIVRIRWPEGMKKTRDNIDYTIVQLPSAKVAWWTLSGNQKAEIVVLTELVMLEIIS